MTVEEFKALRVGQLVKTGTGFWKIIEKIGHTIICAALINQTKAAFSVHDAEGLTLDFAVKLSNGYWRPGCEDGSWSGPAQNAGRKAGNDCYRR